MIWKPHVLAAFFFVLAGCFGQSPAGGDGVTTTYPTPTVDKTSTDTDTDVDTDVDTDTDADTDYSESTPGHTGG